MRIGITHLMCDMPQQRTGDERLLGRDAPPRLPSSACSSASPTLNPENLTLRTGNEQLQSRGAPLRQLSSARSRASPTLNPENLKP